MAVTATDAIATLESAMSRGVTDVTYSDGRRVSYADASEMLKAIAYFRAQIATAAGRPPVSVSTGAFYRG